MIFDTHTHYDDAAFDKDRFGIIESLPKNNVGRICNIGATMNGARASVAFSEKYDFVYAAAGVHPDEVYDFYPGKTPDDIEAMYEQSSAGFEAYGNAVFNELKALAEHKKTAAVGEIGLDYHGYDIYEVKPGKELQKYWFKKQLDYLQNEYGVDGFKFDGADSHFYPKNGAFAKNMPRIHQARLYSSFASNYNLNEPQFL